MRASDMFRPVFDLNDYTALYEKIKKGEPLTDQDKNTLIFVESQLQARTERANVNAQPRRDENHDHDPKPPRFHV